MNAYTKPQSSYSTGGSPCGCGGSAGTSSAAKCSCGETGCTSCRNQGYARPQFFAGQLLTEEDLQALSDYVVSKNRLHNRYLFGAGVVCGLEVTCHPCGGGIVVVNPGYALDCCGNDIQLACSQELDINSMVRDLRRNMLGGYECGDPCASKKKKPCPPEDNAQNQGGAADAQASEVVAEPTDPSRYYCLYVRYCEELTDPVTPYATDEGCGFQSCEPSRVREGVRFELRCEEDDKKPVDLFTRVLGCIGDLTTAMRSARTILFLSAADQYRTDTAAVEKADSRLLVNNKREEFAGAVEKLNLVTGTGATSVESKDAASAAGAQKPAASSGQRTLKDSEFEEALHNIREAASYLAAYQLAGEQPQGGASDAKSPAGEGGARVSATEIEQAKANLRQAIAAISPQVKDKASTSLEQAYAYDILDAARKVTADQPAEGPQKLELQAIQEGQFASTQYLAEKSRALAELRENLLDRLDAKVMLGDCSLRHEVLAIAIPSATAQPAGPGFFGPVRVDDTQMQEATRAITEAWIRYLVDCICLALNPVCAPCDDTGVLLACLEVEDCEVVDICNMSRSFVLTGPALRYWLPPLGWLGELIEKFCCTDIILPAGQTGRNPLTPNRPLMMSSGRSTRNAILSASNIVSNIATTRGARIPSYSTDTISRTIASAVTRLASSDAARRTVSGSPELRRVASALFSTGTGGGAEASAADVESRIKEGIAAALTKEKLAETIAEAMTSTSARDAVTSIVEKQLKEGKESGGAKAAATAKDIASATDERINAALDKAKLSNISNELKEIKRLKTENADLKKRFSELEGRLKKLEG
jgi:hypothetical protein